MLCVVLCAVCCVLCAVLCAVCCVLRAVWGWVGWDGWGKYRCVRQRARACIGGSVHWYECVQLGGQQVGGQAVGMPVRVGGAGLVMAGMVVCVRALCACVRA